MYRRIEELTIDPDKAFGCDSVLIDIDVDKEPLKLRVSFFKDCVFYDEVVVEFKVDDDGVCTDTDVWKKRCLELAAALDAVNKEDKT